MILLLELLAGLALVAAWAVYSYRRTMRANLARMKQAHAEDYDAFILEWDANRLRCRNCQHVKRAHSEDGKCLFGAGSWVSPKPPPTPAAGPGVKVYR